MGCDSNFQKAINYLHEHPSPHLMQEEEDWRAFEEAIPFDIGSEEWCFTILIIHKLIYIIGRSSIYDYEGVGTLSLLLKDQGPKDALIALSQTAASLTRK